MSDLFTSLPSSLACIVLQDWLSLKSIIALNSAYCANNYREGFTRLFLLGEYTIQSQALITSVSVKPGSSLLALLKQEKKIQSVRFAQPQVSRKQMKVLAKHCQCWTHIHLDCIDSEKVNVWSLLLSNPNIVSLKITQRTGKWVCPTVMTSLPGGIQLPNLRNLSIRNTNMSNQMFFIGFTSINKWKYAYTGFFQV